MDEDNYDDDDIDRISWPTRQGAGQEVDQGAEQGTGERTGQGADQAAAGSQGRAGTQSNITAANLLIALCQCAYNPPTAPHFPFAPFHSTVHFTSSSPLLLHRSRRRRRLLWPMRHHAAASSLLLCSLLDLVLGRNFWRLPIQEQLSEMWSRHSRSRTT